MLILGNGSGRGQQIATGAREEGNLRKHTNVSEPSYPHKTSRHSRQLANREFGFIACCEGFPKRSKYTQNKHVSSSRANHSEDRCAQQEEARLESGISYITNRVWFHCMRPKGIRSPSAIKQGTLNKHVSSGHPLQTLFLFSSSET